MELDESCSLSTSGLDEVLAVNEALCKLASESPDQAELVKLRYFAGMSLEEAAQSLGISPPTAVRYWSYAKCSSTVNWRKYAIEH